MSSKSLLQGIGAEVKGNNLESSMINSVNKITPIKFYVPKGDKISAVKSGLIPEAYKECDFDIEKVSANIVDQVNNSPRKFFVRKFADYKEITSGIISTIESGMVPNQSYLIGAPNGFGKTSFVNTCIMKLYGQGKMCTPYISLTDLAQVKVSNDKRLLNGINARLIYDKYNDAESGEDYIKAYYDGYGEVDYQKRPINLIDRFSWSEYMNSDILFCYFTDVSSKVLESEIFKTAITIRGAKGLPTIATISTSLNPYKNDKYLGEFVWNEILTYREDGNSFDRVKHISCYKDYNAPLSGNI